MSDKETELIEKTLLEIKNVQSLIDNYELTLIGLRAYSNDEFTHKEIKRTESKLVHYFSKQIVIKNKLGRDDLDEKLSDYPKTKQWLSVVGIPKETIKNLLEQEQDMDLYHLLEVSETDVKELLLKYGASAEDARGLNLALRNLKISIKMQLSSEGNNIAGDSDIELHWTSATSQPPYPEYHRRSPRPSTSSISSGENSTFGVPAQTHSTPPSPVAHSHNDRIRSVGKTPPQTPPTVRTPKTKYPITPPPKKKNYLFPDSATISRSRSQESNLAHKVQDIDPVKSGKKKPGSDKKDTSLWGSNVNLPVGLSYDFLPLRRLSSDHEGGSRGPSGPASPIITSPIHSPPFMQGTSEGLVVPGGQTVKMKHQINHKYVNKIMIGSTCDICKKNLFRGKFCKYCRFKCHKDCVNRAPPSCGLPDELVDIVKSVFEGPSNPRRSTNPNLLLQATTPELRRSAQSVPAFQVPDSSSTSASSTDTSNHSSPAHVGTSPAAYASPHLSARSFQFPDTCLGESSTDITQTEPIVAGVWDRDLDVVSTNTSNDSDKTIVDSNTSEVTLLDSRVDSVDSQDENIGHSWNRNNSLSVALKEWDIPYEELIQEEPLGTGRFGTVYKGQWHGDVAIKMLSMDPGTDNAAQLSAFKLEVAMLRKTRHENLVLFMGACMKPPHLAIVTSLCRGKSLFNLVHVRKEKFPMNKTIIIAQQVAQGMGYLHAKRIIHKDLKTKNIFFDRDKVVITDFGLFNVTKLCDANRHVDRLQIPPGWLCYLSPEIIRSLQAGAAYAQTDLPFSENSDVYAFGTVWYELLNGVWPFESQPPESIIWQVGHGIKQSLGSIRGSKEVKDLLIMCWAYKPTDRPTFSQVLKVMERLPKKPFQRSPSHPIHLLSRSADSLHTS